MSRFGDCISHIDDIPPFPYEQPTEFGGRGARIGISRATGGQRLELDITIVPPGNRLSFSHWHSASEEVFYVMKGNPTVVIGGEEHRLRPGSVLTRPAGSGIPHHFENNGGEDAWIMGANNVPGSDEVDEVFRPEIGLAYNTRTQEERAM